VSSVSLEARASAFLQTLSASVLPRETLPRDTAHSVLSSDPYADAVLLSDNLEFGETLGEGGMGIVRLAVQRSVKRAVAVKSQKLKRAGAVRSESDARLGARLLEEAWITGALDHPNIVPIYDISRDHDGEPLIVMRRIAGHSWEKALAQEIEAQDDTKLEANLRILIQVSNAIAAAHARGIVHRDLKPANVMLGKYGEVYVVDWGIAAALEAVEHLDIPILPSDPAVGNAVVGTPCYMAPEMLTGHASRATDVYLLGGIAYELATGKAPHEATNMTAAVASIMMTPPRVPEHVDHELAQLLCKALAYEPEARFSSAAEFSKALERYLQNRNSVQTAHIGLVQVSQLEARAALGAQVSSSEIEGLLGIARFSFQAALREWHDNTVAKSGLARAYVAAGRHALASGDPERAFTIAQSAPLEVQDDGSLFVLKEDAARAVEKHRRELATLTARGDTATGGRTRAFASVLTSSIWFIGPAWAWWHASATGHALAHEVAIGSVLQILVWTALVVWARSSMTKTVLATCCHCTWAVWIFCFLTQGTHKIKSPA
jgi:eukaryotic-like serine/threonine-protein kinase